MNGGKRSSAAKLLRDVAAGYAPPPRFSVSEFADREIIVTSGPLAGTHWQTDLAPYQRGIMDAFHEPGVEIVVVMGSSQWGKTACAVNLIAYHIAHDPCSIQVVFPTVDPMAKDFAKNRLEPIIAASPVLSEAVSKKRTRNASNTTLSKTFRGGSISIGGANSASSLAARASRVLYGDEIDRWPVELPGEGNTLSIALKRTTTFRGRRRVLFTSSPTVTGAAIHAWFQRGDQRRYHVPCPKCGSMHAYEWANVKWVDRDPSTARLRCPACDYAMEDAERIAVLSKGTWVADQPDRKDARIVSFHLWEAYSPFSSLHDIVANFLSAFLKRQAGDKSEMHTFENTTLGQPVDVDQMDGVKPEGLFGRREFIEDDHVLPPGVCCLTMGVDTQDDRLEVVVWGWGPGEEAWIVDRKRIAGDTSQPEPWAELDSVLDTPYTHSAGVNLHIQATCIDSAGHRTNLVYDYAEKRAARKVFAIIGRDGDRPMVSSPSPRRWGRDERHVDLYTLGVDAAKSLLLTRLAMTDKGSGFIHLLETDWCDQEFVEQLTSEVLVTRWKKGIAVRSWKKRRARNEGLDCGVYALCAMRLLNPDLQRMSARLQVMHATPPAPGPRPPAAPVGRPVPRPRRVSHSAYLATNR